MIFLLKSVSEEWEECYPEPFDPDFIIIPLYWLPRFTSQFEFMSYEEMEYNRKMNEEIIRQMQAKGYKYNVCDEDIEFYK